MEERNSWSEGIRSVLRNILRSLCQNMSPFNAFHAFMSILVYGPIYWLQSFLGQFLFSDQHVCFELVEQFDNSIGFHSSPWSLSWSAALGLTGVLLIHDILLFQQYKTCVLRQRKNMALRRDFHFYLKTPTNHGPAKTAINWFVSLLLDVVSFSLC
jgi:hypothetical protein